jgi:WhiB family transcriptional regulator, redox-sensing transcriptional regulator
VTRQEDLTFRWRHLYVDDSWQEQAACAEEDPALFFPVLGSNRALYNQQVLEAQMICLNCPVIGECLQYALAVDIRYGVWGGASEIDRARLKGRRRAHE